MASKRNASPVRARRRALAVFVAFAMLAAAHGCASTQKGDGSESHFVNCSSDATCAELGLGKCIGGKCERSTNSPDASITSADGGATPCSEPAPFECIDDCGHDGLSQAACSNGFWTCPPNAPLRVDECPFVCGHGLYPPCCGTYGQEPRICPDGARAICPPGTFEYRDGNCPTDCAVAADPKLPVPYPMTFRFTNASGKKIAVWHGCIMEFELTACATRYTQPVQTAVICGPVCPNTNQPTCGACYDEPAPVTASTPVDYAWEGYLFSDGSFGGRPCAEQIALTATRYRIKVPVYSDAPPMLPSGGYEKTPLYTVSVDFTTSPNGVVEIPIDQGP